MGPGPAGAQPAQGTAALLVAQAGGQAAFRCVRRQVDTSQPIAVVSVLILYFGAAGCHQEHVGWLLACLAVCCER